MSLVSGIVGAHEGERERARPVGLFDHTQSVTTVKGPSARCDGSAVDHYVVRLLPALVGLERLDR